MDLVADTQPTIQISSQLDLKEMWTKTLNSLSLFFQSNQELKAKVTTRQLAKELNRSGRQIHRYILEMVQRGLINYEYQVGRNGGLEVTLNNKLIHPLQVVKQEAQDTPNQKAKTFIPRGVLNKQLNQAYQNHQLTAETFQQLPEPEISLGGYLLGRAYDIYYRLIVNELALKQQGHPKKTHSIFPETKLFGSSQLTCFENLYKWCLDTKTNPLAYLASQFNRAKYIAEQKHIRLQAPRYNTLLNPDAQAIYQKQMQFDNDAYRYFDVNRHSNYEEELYYNNPTLTLIKFFWFERKNNRDFDYIHNDIVKTMENDFKNIIEQGGTTLDNTLLDTRFAGSKYLYQASHAFTYLYLDILDELDHLDISASQKENFLYEVRSMMTNQWNGYRKPTTGYYSKVAQHALGTTYQTFANLGQDRLAKNPTYIPRLWSMLYQGISPVQRAVDSGALVPEDTPLAQAMLKNVNDNLEAWATSDIDFEVGTLLGDILQFSQMAYGQFEQILDQLSDKVQSCFTDLNKLLLPDNAIEAYKQEIGI